MQNHIFIDYPGEVTPGSRL